MSIRLPPTPVPVEKQSLSYTQVAHRWRTRVSIAKMKLQTAGVPTVYVPQQPVEGVRMTDLLRYEAQVRKEQEARS